MANCVLYWPYKAIFMNQAIIQREYIIHWQNQITLVSFKDGDNLISYGPNNYISAHGEVAQWLGHRIVNRKISSSKPCFGHCAKGVRYLKPKRPYGSLS